MADKQNKMLSFIVEDRCSVSQNKTLIIIGPTDVKLYQDLKLREGGGGEGVLLPPSLMENCPLAPCGASPCIIVVW